MTNVVNLRQFRKRKAREDKEAQSTANRVKYGRTKSETLKDKGERARRENELDAQRLDTDKPEEP